MSLDISFCLMLKKEADRSFFIFIFTSSADGINKEGIDPNPPSNFHLPAGHGVLHYPWPSTRCQMQDDKE